MPNNTSIIDSIISEIKQNRFISIFFHELPDGDALGAAFGFSAYIKFMFPDKDIRIVGIEQVDRSNLKDIFTNLSERLPTDDDFISSSLAIVLDTANKDRIFSKKAHLAKKVIKIDHHANSEAYGAINWIEPTASSTCEMIIDLICHYNLDGLTRKVAFYLYTGLITDSGRYLHPSTTAHTFEAARILMDTGFNWTLLHENLYTKSLNEKKLEIYLSKKIVYDTNNQIAHLIIPKGIHKRFNVPNACSMIYLLSDVKEMNAWISIYYDEELKVWKGSIRSRRFDVATVASKYNGGGHKLAAGFKLTKISDFHKIITDLILAVKTK